MLKIGQLVLCIKDYRCGAIYFIKGKKYKINDITDSPNFLNNKIVYKPFLISVNRCWFEYERKLNGIDYMFEYFSEIDKCPY